MIVLHTLSGRGLAGRGRRAPGTVLPALALMAALWLIPASGAFAQPHDGGPPWRVPLDEVLPGLTGYGLTVFAGTEPDTFRVVVLGRQRAARAGGDIILVELAGHDLALSAVARGMSGSPVYLDDGRLLGAIAFGWPGALRPIAGLTPAVELDSVRDRPPQVRAGAAGGPVGRRDETGGRSGATALLDAPLPGSLAARLLGGGDPDAGTVAEGGATAVRGAGETPHDVWPTVEQLALRLLPRRTGGAGTLAAAPGFGRDAALLVPLDLGIYAQAAGRSVMPAPGSAPDAGPAVLVPGSACAIALVAGDAHLGAMGTVSLVEGDRIVLMAHPFMQLGPVDLPLASASVVTLFPSRELSFKMGSAGPIVGRITHDLRAGLAGLLGQRAPTVPVTVAVEMPGGRRTYSFETALQPELTPQLVFWCLYNALLAEGDDRSQQLVRYDISFALQAQNGRALPQVDLRGVTGGPGGVNALQGDWQAPLQVLLGNRHEPLTLAGVQAVLRLEKPLRRARILALHAPARILPGEVFTVEVELEGGHGRRWRERFDLRAPDNLRPGMMRLGAASARDFFRLDALRAGGLFEDHGLEAMLDLLNRPRSADELTVALIAPGVGFTAAGRELTGLPPSVRRTLAAGPPGAARPTLAAYLSRESRPTGMLLLGDAVLEIEVRLPPAPRTEGARP